MVLSIDEKAFIFEVFLKKHKLYDRYVAYQHKHHNREIIDVVKENNFFNLMSGTILWGLELEDFMELNHLDHIDDPGWSIYSYKWEYFVNELFYK
jgi:hypothetical protein